MKRFRKSAIALILALLMALQGTEPIFVQAKEAIEDVQKNADFSRPEALTEEEAGITDSTSGEQDKSQQSDADVQNETTLSIPIISYPASKMKRHHQKIQRLRKNRQLQRKKQKKIRRKKKWN